eukprot:16000563-Heterocapsa_arctica.AAC.1
MMKDDKNWTEATILKKLLMTCYHMSTTKMRAERKYISAFGAIRMTKEEAIEMNTNCVRYQNLWGHVTGYEDDEERGGKIQKLGYLFYRDYGNEIYGELL